MRYLLTEKYRVLNGIVADNLIVSAQGNKNELRKLMGINIIGALWIHTSVKELPIDLIVTGGIDLSSTKIKALPAGFKCGGRIHIDYTDIVLKKESWSNYKL